MAKQVEKPPASKKRSVLLALLAAVVLVIASLFGVNAYQDYRDSQKFAWLEQDMAELADKLNERVTALNGKWLVAVPGHMLCLRKVTLTAPWGFRIDTAQQCQ